MPAITLPDGSVRRFDGPVTGTTVAAAIGPGLARAALAMKLDGKLVDLATRDRPRRRRGIRHPPRPRGAGADPPRRRPCAGRGGAGALSRAPRSPSARRSRTASTTTSPATSRSRRTTSPRSRRRCARSSRAASRSCAQVMDRDEAIALLRRTRARSTRPRLIQDLPRDETDHALPPGRLARPVPRPAHALHRRCRRRVQADEGRRRLLARRSPQRHAAAHLRHRLARPEGARRLPAHAGGGGEARPPPDRQGDGPVPPPGRGGRLRVLAPQGLDALPHRRGLHPPPAGGGGLPGGEDAAAAGPHAVGALGPLGQVPREHVHRPGRGRGQDARAEADELPVPRADLQPGHPQLPRPAAAAGRVRLLPPLRAVGRAARHHAGARFTQDDAHIFCTEEQIAAETRAVRRAAVARSIATSASRRSA